MSKPITRVPATASSAQIEKILLEDGVVIIDLSVPITDAAFGR